MKCIYCQNEATRWTIEAETFAVATRLCFDHSMRLRELAESLDADTKRAVNDAEYDDDGSWSKRPQKITPIDPNDLLPKED